MKIPKWQHKLVRDYKREKLVSYFLNNAAKTCLYGLKTSENIKIEHIFQPKIFFISLAISTQVASDDDVFESIYIAIISNIKRILGKSSGCIIDSVIDHSINISKYP